MYERLTFKDGAGKGEVNPIIGGLRKVYVAPGSRLEKKTSSGGRVSITIWSCWPKTKSSYQILIDLPRRRTLEGYYYKPRIDKEILAGKQEGPDRALRWPGQRNPRVHYEGPIAEGGARQSTGSNKLWGRKTSISN